MIVRIKHLVAVGAAAAVAAVSLTVAAPLADPLHAAADHARAVAAAAAHVTDLPPLVTPDQARSLIVDLAGDAGVEVTTATDTTGELTVTVTGPPAQTADWVRATHAQLPILTAHIGPEVATVSVQVTPR